MIQHYIQGVNISIVAIGSSESGKSYTLCGSGNDPGVVQFFIDGLFNTLDRKENDDEEENEAEEEQKSKHENETAKNYSLRMQFIEIVNEGVNDLLAKGKGGLIVESNEWEGSRVQGADWKLIKDPQEFNDLYVRGLDNRINIANEYGRLSDKAGTILTLSLIQTINSEESDEDQILVSKATFIECPGTESLMQNSVYSVGKNDNPLNKGVTALQKVILEVMSERVEAPNYGGSQLTRMMEETFGGNCLTSIIFNFQYDDQIGSTITMKLLKQCQRIINYPISNDSRAICLIHKHRLVTNHLRQIIYERGEENIEKYQAKIAELEKQLIGGNVDALKLEEEQKSMNARLFQMKDKYNEVVKQKAEIQSQLLVLEEEKLNLSKGLIEQKIVNSKLQEELQIIKCENTEKGMSELDQSKNDISELQNSLKKLTEEKHEFEVELMTVKRNYFNKCHELEELKKKNEKIGIEFVNVMNENQELKRKGGMPKIGTISPEASHRLAILEAENEKIKQEFSKLEMQLNRSNSEKIRAEAMLEELQLEFDKKKLILEKEYIAMVKNKEGQISKTNKVAKEANNFIERDKAEWEVEKLEFVRKIKELYRKLEGSNMDLQDLKEQNDELKQEKVSLEMQLNNATSTLRNKMGLVTEAEAKNELIKN